MDVDPGADGHLLVIPKQHSRDLLSVSPEDLTATTLVAQRIAKAMYTELGAEGVNLLNCCGTAGWQTVFHFHLHVIPSIAIEVRTEWSCPSSRVCRLTSMREHYARLLSTVL